MTMHEHDIDRIMALAEGDLAAPEVDAAAAEIAACERCSEDLQLQRAALVSLDETRRVYLTASESARLRSRVRSDLGIETDAVPVMN